MRLVNKKHYIIAISQSVSTRSTGQQASFTGRIASIGGDRMRRLFPLLVLLVFVGMSSATDYYVATWGDNTTQGNFTHPWQNVSYATQQAVAGDTIHLFDGTWYDEHAIFANSGNATHPITITAYNGTPTLDGQDYSLDGGRAFDTNQQSYINISYIKIRNYAIGIYVYGSDVSNITITHNDINGYACAVKQYTKCTDMTITHNLLNSDPNGQDALYPWQNDRLNVSYNTITTSGWNGMGMAGANDSYCGYNIIHGKDGNKSNIAHNGIDLHGTRDSIIEYNEVYDVKDNGIYPEGTTKQTYNVTLRYNNVHNTTSRGLAPCNAYNYTVIGDRYYNGDGTGVQIITSHWENYSLQSGKWTLKNVSIHDNAQAWETSSAFKIENIASDSIDYGGYKLIDCNITSESPARDISFDTVELPITLWIINTKLSRNDIGFYQSSTSHAENYYYLDVKVEDENGNPIEGATVTVENNENASRKPLNLEDTWPPTNVSTTYTGVNGHTPLPSNASWTVAIMDNYETSASTTYYTHNITASKTGYSSNTTTVNPDSSWYRSDPNTYQNTTTIILSSKGLYIADYYPASVSGKNAGDSQFFNVTTNETSNCTWYVNGLQMQYNSSSLTHNYTNSSLVAGGCNVTALVDAGVETDSQTWLFDVGYVWSPSVFGNYYNITDQIEITVKGYGNRSHIFNRAPRQSDNNATSSFNLVVKTT